MLKTFNDLKNQIADSITNKNTFVCVGYNTDSTDFIPKFLEEEGYKVFEIWAQQSNIDIYLEDAIGVFEPNHKYALFFPQITYYRSEYYDILNDIIVNKRFKDKDLSNIIVCADAMIREYSDDVEKIKTDKSSKTDILKSFTHIHKWFNYSEESWAQIAPYLHEKWDSTIGAETLDKVMKYAFVYDEIYGFENNILSTIELLSENDSEKFKRESLIRKEILSTCRLGKKAPMDPLELKLYSKEQLDKSVDDLVQFLTHL